MIGSEELRIAAILTGDVGAEPVVDLVTDAEAEDARAVEVQGLNRRRVVAVEQVVQAIDALITEADVAAQIPAAEVFDHRGRRVYWRRHNRHVGGKRRLGQQCGRTGGNE